MKSNYTKRGKAGVEKKQLPGHIRRGWLNTAWGARSKKKEKKLKLTLPTPGVEKGKNPDRPVIE